jgi:pyridoxal phosphate enzyme (YggS family)
VEDTERQDLARRLAEVRARLDAAARRAGRDPVSVSLMAVTKGHPRETLEAAMTAGLSLFGENRVQEAEEKLVGLPAGAIVHLIGHLQRNKARTASGLFACVQSVDKLDTAAALDARCAERGRTMDILLEVNTSGEPAKSGFLTRDDLLRALEGIAALPTLRTRGLMTVGPLTADADRVRSSFALLKGLFDEIRGSGPRDGFDTLSMGMSGDFEIAVEEGSTLVRVGTALFGPRVAR